jgi:hypothetical protein
MVKLFLEQEIFELDIESKIIFFIMIIIFHKYYKVGLIIAK